MKDFYFVQKDLKEDNKFRNVIEISLKYLKLHLFIGTDFEISENIRNKSIILFKIKDIYDVQIENVKITKVDSKLILYY